MFSMSYLRKPLYPTCIMDICSIFETNELDLREIGYSNIPVRKPGDDLKFATHGGFVVYISVRLSIFSIAGC